MRFWTFLGRGGEGDDRIPPSSISSGPRFAETERVIGRCDGPASMGGMSSSLELSDSFSSTGILLAMGGGGGQRNQHTGALWVRPFSHYLRGDRLDCGY